MCWLVVNAFGDRRKKLINAKVSAELSSGWRRGRGQKPTKRRSKKKNTSSCGPREEVFDGER